MSRIYEDNGFEEYYGNDFTGTKFIINNESGSLSEICLRKPYKSLKELFKNIFLPEGYPESVSEDYSSYQLWDTAQAFCSSVSGALAATAVFESIGVGDDKATVYGATVTWLIKDGTGMIGRILFAWYQGSSLDSNSKMWRLFADILNDLSFFVDLLSPYFVPTFRIYIVSLAGLFRSIVGVAGGATRSSLTQHQAIKNNMADVSAKDSSQETLVNLVALIFNLCILSYIKDNKLLVWQLFLLFVIGHIYTNYRAVKSIVMNTFNQNRYHILVQHYLNNSENLLTPLIVNKLEPVLNTVKRSCKISLGNSLKQVKSLTEKQIKELLTNRYSLIMKKSNSIVIILHKSSTNHDLLKALFQVELIEFALNIPDKSIRMNNEYSQLIEAAYRNNLNEMESQSLLLSNQKIDSFLKKITLYNWSIAYTQFSPGFFRYGHIKSL